MTLTSLVNAPDINLDAAIGPLGVFIRNGRVQLDNGTVGQAAEFKIGLVDEINGDDRHTIGDLISNTESREDSRHRPGGCGPAGHIPDR